MSVTAGAMLIVVLINSQSPEIKAANLRDDMLSAANASIKKNLKDPDSYEVIDYDINSDIGKTHYLITVRYRAKNSFGGYVINSQSVSFMVIDGDIQLLE